MRRHAHLLLFVFGLLAVHTPTVEAHFLFIRIGGQAEAGRQVDVFFSEIARAGEHPQNIGFTANRGVGGDAAGCPFAK